MRTLPEAKLGYAGGFRGNPSEYCRMLANREGWRTEVLVMMHDAYSTAGWMVFDMADYRRCYVPDGSFFFTSVTERWTAILGDDLSRDLLRAAFRACQRRWPFRVDPLVMLCDHLHVIWTLRPGDTELLQTLGPIEKYFTQSWLALGGSEQPRTASRSRNRLRGIWQRRFWEHTLRNERDHGRHCDDLHYTRSNTIGWIVRATGRIPLSTAGWNRALTIGNGIAEPLDRFDLAETVGE